MRRTVVITLLSLFLVGSCQRGKTDQPPPPNASRKPAGEGWWCVRSPNVRLSCQRSQGGCEGQRGQMLEAQPNLELPACEQLASASCLTFRPRGSGHETSFCLATTEWCEATRKQLVDSAAEKGHTMISGCATWK